MVTVLKVTIAVQSGLRVLLQNRTLHGVTILVIRWTADSVASARTCLVAAFGRDHTVLPKDRAIIGLFSILGCSHDDAL